MTGKYVDMGKEIHFSVGGKLYYANSVKHTGFDTIRAALQKGDYEAAVKAFKEKVTETETLKIKDDVITVKGTGIKLGETYVESYLYAKQFGKLSEAWLDKFFENVAKNPDKNARDGLSDFMAHGRLPITDRGTFLTYRRVRANFTDPQTGRMDNMIGNVVSMPREECDSDPRKSCSRGLHVCHHDYADITGPYTLVVEVRPQDVVAVPTSYSAKKMRTCAFRPLCTLDYFKRMLLVTEQAALGRVPVLLTEQTREWDPLWGVPQDLHDRYKPVDPWKWAKG